MTVQGKWWDPEKRVKELESELDWCRAERDAERDVTRTAQAVVDSAKRRVDEADKLCNSYLGRAISAEARLQEALRVLHAFVTVQTDKNQERAEAFLKAEGHMETVQ